MLEAEKNPNYINPCSNKYFILLMLWYSMTVSYTNQNFYSLLMQLLLLHVSFTMLLQEAELFLLLGAEESQYKLTCVATNCECVELSAKLLSTLGLTLWPQRVYCIWIILLNLHHSIVTVLGSELEVVWGFSFQSSCTSLSCAGWKQRSRLMPLLGSDEKHNVDGDQSAPYKMLHVEEMFRNMCARFFWKLILVAVTWQ